MRSLILAFLFASAAFAQRNQIQVLLASTDAPVTPVDMPGGGTYSSTQSVTITDATATFILYTLDTSTPACPGTGMLYSGAFNISATTTLKAIGCNGITGGAVLTSVYTIGAGAGYSLIGCKSATDSGSTGTTTTLVTTGASVLTLQMGDGVGTGVGPSTYSDALGNTWNLRTLAYNNEGPASAVIAYSYAHGSGALTTGTDTASVAWYYGSFTFCAWSGGLTYPSNPYYSENINANIADVNSIQPCISTPCVTPPAAGSLVLTVVAAATSGTAPTLAAYTVTQANAIIGGISYATGQAYTITGSTQSPTWANIASGSYPVATIAVFH